MADRPAPYLAAVVQSGVEAFLKGASDADHLARNTAHVLRWIRILCESAYPPRLIVFPILPLVGSSIRPTPSNRTRVQLVGPLDTMIAPIADACARYDCYVAMSGLERHPATPDDTYHTAFVVNGEGVVLRQPKFQAHGLEELEFVRGLHQRYVDAVGAEAVNQVVETPIGRLGAMLDRDLLIPEVARTRAKAGAEVIVHPSLAWPGEVVRAQDLARTDLVERSWQAWPDSDVPFQAMRQTLAYQNCVFLLTANHGFERWEDDGRTVLHQGRGGSMIAGPDGQVLASCDASGEGYAIATIDLGRVDAARADHAAVSTPIWEFYSGTYR